MRIRNAGAFTAHLYAVLMQPWRFYLRVIQFAVMLKRRRSDRSGILSLRRSPSLAPPPVDSSE